MKAMQKAAYEVPGQLPFGMGMSEERKRKKRKTAINRTSII